MKAETTAVLISQCGQELDIKNYRDNAEHEAEHQPRPRRVVVRTGPGVAVEPPVLDDGLNDGRRAVVDSSRRCAADALREGGSDGISSRSRVITKTRALARGRRHLAQLRSERTPRGRRATIRAVHEDARSVRAVVDIACRR